jgi:hypothetical protein
MKLTELQRKNREFAEECQLSNRTKATCCLGQQYVSGNKQRESGYENCKHESQCKLRRERESVNDISTRFVYVKDFRTCDLWTK